MTVMTGEVLKELQSEGITHTLVDVRERDEWDAGHIEGAVHIPLGILPFKIMDVASDKNALIILYCRTGGRSGMGCQMIEKSGYTNVQNLELGYLYYKTL